MRDELVIGAGVEADADRRASADRDLVADGIGLPGHRAKAEFAAGVVPVRAARPAGQLPQSLPRADDFLSHRPPPSLPRALTRLASLILAQRGPIWSQSALHLKIGCLRPYSLSSLALAAKNTLEIDLSLWAPRRLVSKKCHNSDEGPYALRLSERIRMRTESPNSYGPSVRV